jgi:Aminoglycoside adenylyltransferase, C-terminal domain
LNAPPDRPPLPADFQRRFERLRRDLETMFGTAVASLFSYGALAFPHPVGWRSDLDFHVLLERPLTTDEQSAIEAIHARLGTDVDGYYVTVEDARRREPPRHQLDLTVRDEAWALHRAHVCAGRYFLIVGLDPRELMVEPTWEEIDTALRSELRFIVEHPQHAEFGILNACRILYTVEHGDAVVSKYASAQWARARVTKRERAAIDAAVQRYLSDSETDHAVLASGWSALVARAQRALAPLRSERIVP